MQPLIELHFCAWETYSSGRWSTLWLASTCLPEAWASGQAAPVQAQHKPMTRCREGALTLSLQGSLIAWDALVKSWSQALLM